MIIPNEYQKQSQSDYGNNITIEIPFLPPYEEVYADFKPILPTFYHALETAIQNAKAQFKLWGKEKVDRFLFSHLVRYFAKDILNTDKLPIFDEFPEEDIEYKFNLLVNNGLSGVYNGYSFRILKSAKGEIPLPPSKERLKYYNHQLFMTSLFEDKVSSIIKVRPNILILWDINSNYELTQLRLACTKASDLNQTKVQVHFNEPISHPAETMSEKPKDIKEDLPISKKEAEIEETQNNDIRRTDKAS